MDGYRALRIESMISNIMHDGKLPDNLALAKNIKPLVPIIDKTASKLLSLSNLNRTVHLPTYNKLIHEATTSASTIAPPAAAH